MSESLSNAAKPAPHQFSELHSDSRVMAASREFKRIVGTTPLYTISLKFYSLKSFSSYIIGNS
jgi:hypothetical protein